MSESDTPVIVVNLSGSDGLAEIRRLLDEGREVVAVSDDPAPLGEIDPGDGRLVVLVDDGESRSMAVAAALEAARELFPNRPDPEVVEH